MGDFKTTMSLDELRQRHETSQQQADAQRPKDPPPPSKKG